MHKHQEESNMHKKDTLQVVSSVFVRHVFLYCVARDDGLVYLPPKSYCTAVSFPGRKFIYISYSVCPHSTIHRFQCGSQSYRALKPGSLDNTILKSVLNMLYNFFWYFGYVCDQTIIRINVLCKARKRYTDRS